MNLTLNFTLSELVYSGAAYKLGINNQPSQAELENLQSLAETLQIIRDAISVPITVSSGFRCAELNKAVGGSKTSSHMQGLAADIHAKDYTPKLLAEFIVGLGIDFDQLILEKVGSAEWVHIGINKPNRKQVLTYQNGMYQNGLV